ncbi:MAG: hypothetical protein DRJ45_04205 [Thermoprotei archaeon]|nr:MAG: hypothetical protein DRJ45_04205 [Thermoprotei archaeon]
MENYSQESIAKTPYSTTISTLMSRTAATPGFAQLEPDLDTRIMPLETALNMATIILPYSSMDAALIASSAKIGVIRI